MKLCSLCALETCSLSLCYSGRRSVEEEIEPPDIKQDRSTPEPEPLPTDPLPFNFIEHGARYRRSYDNCQPNGRKYVLFILDTSGSIGRENFVKMTATLSLLVHKFCSPVQVAAMTFSDEHFLEFCFDCHGSDLDGRDDIRGAMKSIPYRSGWTHTGGATQCACDSMLTSECGLESVFSGDRCIDIVYITDGRSNGPISPCNAIDCFYEIPQAQVKVVAIGITNNVRQSELECIVTPPDGATSANHATNHLFQFEDFETFQQSINDGIALLDSQLVPFQCFSTPDGFGSD